MGGNSFLTKTNCKPYHFIIMSKQLLISMLRKGSTGDQILNILDAITDNIDDTAADIAGGYADATLDEIAF